LVIYDIPLELVSNILEYKLEITWTESEILQRYPSNTIPNPFEMKWSYGLVEKNLLRIIGGMIGCAFTSDEYDFDYLKSNRKIIYAKSDMETTADVILNIQYIDKNTNWIVYYNKNLIKYAINKILVVLNDKTRQMVDGKNKYYDMIGETFKIPINNIKFVDTNSFISRNFICSGE
jgi:hypothetical protein